MSFWKAITNELFCHLGPIMFYFKTEPNNQEVKPDLTHNESGGASQTPS